MENFKGLGEALRSLRGQRGLTQKEVADRVGLSRRAIGGWESEQNMSMQVLDQALQILDYELVDILAAIEAVNGRPGLRTRPMKPSPDEIRALLAQRLGLEALSPDDRSLFFACLDVLRTSVSTMEALASRRSQPKSPAD